MANGFHLTLPPQQDSYYNNKSKQVSRRAPLTPSTITPPSINAFTPVTRRDSCGSEPSRATALLAKVTASHPSSPRRTPASSPIATPMQEVPQRDHQACRPEPFRTKSRQDAARRNWTHQRQKDGYISFPDYEKYWESSFEDIQRERSRDRSTAKT